MIHSTNKKVAGFIAEPIQVRTVCVDNESEIGHVLNEQGTGYEHIFSWYECSISIELKMGHVI